MIKLKDDKIDMKNLTDIVVKGEPKDIEEYIKKIPIIYHEEILNTGLERSIMMTMKPKIENVLYLLELGANPNGLSENRGYILSYSYNMGLYDILKLLLYKGADINGENVDILEQAIEKNDKENIVFFKQFSPIITEDLINLSKSKPKIYNYIKRNDTDNNDNDIYLENYNSKFFIIRGKIQNLKNIKNI